MQAHARPHREDAAFCSGGGISEDNKAYAFRPAMSKPGKKLSDWIRQRDDTFPVLLMKLMDQKGMDDVVCYKKANVSKNTYWKIRTQASYKPSKPTVLAFAIALELNMEETEALLKSAGFALSGSSIFDRIIQFFIENEDYDIFEINAALYQYDQQTLGC